MSWRMVAWVAMGAGLYAVPVFQVQAVGPAGSVSGAKAISGTGVVVGNYVMPGGTSRGFLFQDGAVTTLTLPAGAWQTWANAVSDAGTVGGAADTGAGLIWDNFGGVAGVAGAYVMGMNGSGDAAGMTADGVAFVQLGGVVTALGQPAGGDWSVANAVNEFGVAAGTAMTATGSFRAFSGGALLGTLGGRNSYGNAVGASGTVVGSAQTGSGAMRAVRWDGGAATNLGTLGGTNSFGYGVNGSGQIVGVSDLTGSAGTAGFLWESGVMYDLNGLQAPGEVWEVLAAYGLNERGQIVGTGRLNGVAQAVLLTPQATTRAMTLAPPVVPGSGVPEPAAMWLVGISVLLLFALRTR